METQKLLAVLNHINCEGYDLDDKICCSHDNGYTYGAFRWGSFQEKDIEEYEGCME